MTLLSLMSPQGVERTPGDGPRRLEKPPKKKGPVENLTAKCDGLATTGTPVVPDAPLKHIPA